MTDAVLPSLLVIRFVPARCFQQYGDELCTTKAAPVQLISTTHGLLDALEKATFQNRSEKNIAAYRIGCAVVKNGKARFQEGSWMTLPVVLAPKAAQVVPDQGIRVDNEAQAMIFYVAEIRYMDGMRWKADKHKLVPSKTDFH